MLKKKAQGMSIKIIIVAVIGLIILVVIVAMLTGKLGIFTGGIESFGDASKTCELQPLASLKEKCGDNERLILSSDAAGKGLKCCSSGGGSGGSSDAPPPPPKK